MLWLIWADVGASWVVDGSLERKVCDNPYCLQKTRGWSSPQHVLLQAVNPSALAAHESVGAYTQAFFGVLLYLLEHRRAPLTELLGTTARSLDIAASSELILLSLSGGEGATPAVVEVINAGRQGYLAFRVTDRGCEPASPNNARFNRAATPKAFDGEKSMRPEHFSQQRFAVDTQLVIIAASHVVWEYITLEEVQALCRNAHGDMALLRRVMLRNTCERELTRFSPDERMKERCAEYALPELEEDIAVSVLYFHPAAPAEEPYSPPGGAACEQSQRRGRSASRDRSACSQQREAAQRPPATARRTPSQNRQPFGASTFSADSEVSSILRHAVPPCAKEAETRRRAERKARQGQARGRSQNRLSSAERAQKPPAPPRAQAGYSAQRSWQPTVLPQLQAGYPAQRSRQFQVPPQPQTGCPLPPQALNQLLAAVAAAQRRARPR